MKFLMLLSKVLIGAMLLNATSALAINNTLANELNRPNDHGVWLEQVLKTKYEKWIFSLHTEQRWGSNDQLLWYYEAEPSIQYDLTEKMKDWCHLCSNNSFLETVTIGPVFTQYQEIKKNTLGKFKWSSVSRPVLEGHVAFTWNGWELTNRIRAEYQNYNTSHYKDYANGRYRIAIYAPWKFSCFNIKPYLSNEFFLRMNTYHTTSPNGLVGGLYEDRFRVGLTADAWDDTLTGALYWQWRPLKQKPGTHPHYYNTYAWGMFLALKF